MAVVEHVNTSAAEVAKQVYWMSLRVIDCEFSINISPFIIEKLYHIIVKKL